jgi:enamine deaminase RidA (YjgF/YER057c/UK114 family)
MIVTMANTTTSGVAQGAGSAKSFTFTVTKVTQAPSGEYCHSVMLQGESKVTVFGTLSRKTHYSFFAPEALPLEHTIEVSGSDLDTALATAGVAVETVTKDGAVFKRLTLMEE